MVISDFPHFKTHKISFVIAQKKKTKEGCGELFYCKAIKSL